MGLNELQKYAFHYVHIHESLIIWQTLPWLTVDDSFIAAATWNTEEEQYLFY